MIKKVVVIFFSVFFGFIIKSTNAAEIVLNGKKYEGKSIETIDGYIMIDGEVIMKGVLVDVVVHGNLLNIDVEYANDIKINGSVQRLSSQQGDVTTEGVSGSVSTLSGHIYSNSIEGNALSNTGNIYIEGVQIIEN